jgi:hypothetical protein
VKLEWEVEPRNHFFDGNGTTKSAQWTDTDTAGIALNELASSLEPDRYHWRVRLLYDPSTTPFQTASRWFTVPSNGWHETDVVLGAFIGGAIWEDRDGDGIRDASEPPMAAALLYLLDASLTPIDAALTAPDGSYRFELPGAGPYAIRVTVPSGYFPTLPDQGSDDTLDSDVDVFSGETPLIGSPYQAFDATGWSAGLRLIGPCTPPDEPIFVYDVRLGPANETILDFQDFNQPGQVTGYNVYRSSDPAPPPGTWPLEGSDIADGDAGTANIQWADTSLDVPPGGIWYYEVAAYNSACGAEGPF